MVRWIEGPHVNAHLDVPSILAIHADLSRILLMGAPAVSTAEATEQSFQAFLQYGSHASVTNNQTENVSTIVKQSKRGLTLIKDLLFIQSTLNAPLSPQGLVNVIHP